MTRRELLARLDSLEYSYWLAVDQVEPFGERQADLRAGYLTQMYYSAHRDDNSSLIRMEDFFPSLGAGDSEGDVQTDEEIAFQLAKLKAMFGGDGTIEVIGGEDAEPHDAEDMEPIDDGQHREHGDSAEPEFQDDGKRAEDGSQ